MILRKNIKYYFIYLLIFIIGASLAAALRFAYGFNIVESINETASAASGDHTSLRGYILFTAEFLTPPLLIFLSAFTIYSCAVGAAASLYMGARFGILLISYCFSGLNPFTHAAALCFLLSAAAMYSYLSTGSALYRNTLRVAAPDPGELLRAKNTLSLFYSFLSVAAITIAAGTALYFFVLYFPI